MTTNNCEKCPYRIIDKRSALDRLDDALLFAIGLVGLLFTVIQVYQNNSLNSFVEISPLLVLGVALPFYVGYVRGAIYDSLIERLRGWIYLVVGVSAYCALILLTSEVGVLSNFFFVFALLAPLSIGYIEQWFKRIFKFAESPQNLFSLSGTVTSSFVLAYGFVFLPRIFGLSDFSLILVQLVVAYPCIIIALMSEKLSRQAQTANLESAYQRTINDLEKNSFKKFRFLRLVLLLSGRLGAYGIRDIVTHSKSLISMTFIFLLVGTFALGNHQNPLFKWIPSEVFGILILLGIICFSVAAFFFLTKEQIELG